MAAAVAGDPHDPFGGGEGPKAPRKPDVFDADYEGEGHDPFKAPEPVWEPEPPPSSTHDVREE